MYTGKTMLYSLALNLFYQMKLSSDLRQFEEIKATYKLLTDLLNRVGCPASRPLILGTN